jgi:hypothetical protein
MLIKFFSKPTPKKNYYTLEDIYDFLHLTSPARFYNKQFLHSLNNHNQEQLDAQTTYAHLDRQTGKTILLLAQALVQVQYSNVVIVAHTGASGRYLQRTFVDYLSILEIDTEYESRFVTYADFLSYKEVGHTLEEFEVPFIDPVCYTTSRLYS